METIIAVQAVLALLPKITVGVTELVNWIRTVRGALQQTGEWDARTEQLFQESLIATGLDPAYQTDAALAAKAN